MIELVNKIKVNIIKLENAFKNTSEQELLIKENSNKWSKKEILGHLIDSAQNNIRRLAVGQYNENEKIVYHQDKWVKLADYQDYNIIDLVNLFVLLNKHFCILLQNLPPEKYDVKTNWGKHEPELVTLQFMANDYLKHMEHHFAQMAIEQG